MAFGCWRAQRQTAELGAGNPLHAWIVPPRPMTYRLGDDSWLQGLPCRPYGRAAAAEANLVRLPDARTPCPRRTGGPWLNASRSPFTAARAAHRFFGRATQRGRLTIKSR